MFSAALGEVSDVALPCCGLGATQSCSEGGICTAFDSDMAEHSRVKSDRGETAEDM